MENIIEYAERWNSLHGNVYDLGNGWYTAQLYNQLPIDGITLDGHYTILFTKDGLIEAYKHGDYATLISYIPIDFDGFQIQSAEDKVFLKYLVNNTMRYRKPYSRINWQGSIGCIFEYDFNLFGVPEYFDLLPIITN